MVIGTIKTRPHKQVQPKWMQHHEFGVHVKLWEVSLLCQQRNTHQSQLFRVSEQLVAASNQPQIYLTSTTAMSQVNYCTVSLDQTHPTSKCPHIGNSETFVHNRNKYFYSRPSGCTNNGPHRRRPIRHRRFSSLKKNPGDRVTPSTGQYDSCRWADWNGACSAPQLIRLAAANSGLTVQVQKTRSWEPPDGVLTPNQSCPVS